MHDKKIAEMSLIKLIHTNVLSTGKLIFETGPVIKLFLRLFLLLNIS